MIREVFFLLSSFRALCLRPVLRYHLRLLPDGTTRQKKKEEEMVRSHDNAAYSEQQHAHQHPPVKAGQSEPICSLLVLIELKISFIHRWE